MKDEPHVFGDDCLACFDAGETPKYIYARFSNIGPCDPDHIPACKTPPNDRVFKLTQHPSSPCHFLNHGPNWNVDFYFSVGIPAQSRLDLTDSFGWFYFIAFNPVCPDEGETFNNLMTCDILHSCGAGGIGVITWTQQATELLESINMQRGNDLFMEMHPLVDGNLIYKFCRLKDATNIKIELEPD